MYKDYIKWRWGSNTKKPTNLHFVGSSPKIRRIVNSESPVLCIFAHIKSIRYEEKGCRKRI